MRPRILICFTIAFVVLTETVLIIYLERSKPNQIKDLKRANTRSKMNTSISQPIEKLLRVILPITFILIFVVYSFTVGKIYNDPGYEPDKEFLKEEPVEPVVIKNQWKPEN